MLRQRADPKFYRTQFIEMLNEFISRNTDEARSETTLRYENGFSAFCKFAHCFGNFDIFRQIEIMQALSARHSGHTNIAVIGQAGYDSDGLLITHVIR